MVDKENLVAYITVIKAILDAIIKIPDLYEIFTKKFEKKATRIAKRNVITIMLRAGSSNDKERINELVLSGVVNSDRVDKDEWEMAQQKVIDYRKSIDGSLKSSLLIVSVDDSHPVNLGVWMMFGYYFDHRSQINIIHVKEYKGQRMQYKMADWMIEEGKSLPISFTDKHDEFDETKKYCGIAVYICFKKGAIWEEITPFENYINQHEHIREVYCMRYFSNDNLTDNHRFEETVEKIEREICKYRAKINTKTEEPVIHLFMNTTTPMALAIGSWFGNFGNIQLYGFSIAEMRYYPAVLLRNKNKV
jgi:hypothetical protein